MAWGWGGECLETVKGTLLTMHAPARHFGPPRVETASEGGGGCRDARETVGNQFVDGGPRETESACKVHSTLNNRQSPPTHQHWNAYRMFKAANDVKRFKALNSRDFWLKVSCNQGLSCQVIFDDFQKKTAMEN